MSYYVKRTSKQNPAGISYVGPMPANRAKREAEAWGDAGESVEIMEATPAVKAEVRRWAKITKADDARNTVYYQGEEMTFARYRLLHEAA